MTSGSMVPLTTPLPLRRELGSGSACGLVPRLLRARSEHAVSERYESQAGRWLRMESARSRISTRAVMQAPRPDVLGAHTGIGHPDLDRLDAVRAEGPDHCSGWALDPPQRREMQEIGARARAAVRS